jgi:CRISPR type I-D-associated protein Csc3/Cas10d
MLELSDVERVLDEYVERIIPAMLRRQYHLTLVKGGPDYPHLPEQSHFAHIVNGIFGLTELVKFLITRKVPAPWLDETVFRKALALYTTHEVHKASDVELMGSSEFSIPLGRLQDEYERLGLDSFAEVDEHLMRAANVHKRSPKHGDVLLGADDFGLRLWLLVRLADTFASVKTPEEAILSLKTYLPELGPALVAKSPPGKHTVHYHEVKDVRGVLTNTIHQAVAGQLQAELGFYPLLYFATGTLYIGPIHPSGAPRDRLIQAVAGEVLRSLTQAAGAKCPSRRLSRRQVGRREAPMRGDFNRQA